MCKLYLVTALAINLRLLFSSEHFLFNKLQFLCRYRLKIGCECFLLLFFSHVTRTETNTYCQLQIFHIAVKGLLSRITSLFCHPLLLTLFIFAFCLLLFCRPSIFFCTNVDVPLDGLLCLVCMVKVPTTAPILSPWKPDWPKQPRE